jgi:hypothetical protein
MERKRGEHPPMRDAALSGYEKPSIFSNETLSRETLGMLHTFDHALIELMFLDLYAKTGRDLETEIPFVPDVTNLKSLVRSDHDGIGNWGFYNNKSRKIFLQERAISYSAKEFARGYLAGMPAEERKVVKKDLVQQIKKSILLRTYLHELHHANSSSMYRRVRNSMWEKEVQQVSGYHERSKPSNMLTSERKSSSLFRLFNEGVTAKMTTETMRRYVYTTAEFTSLFDIILRKSGSSSRNVSQDNDLSAYKKAEIFVDRLILALSKEFGVPEEVVWGAIKRGYTGTDKKVTEYQKWKDEEGVQSDTLDALLGDPERFAQFAEGHFDNLSEMLDNLDTPDCLASHGNDEVQE